MKGRSFRFLLKPLSLLGVLLALAILVFSVFNAHAANSNTQKALGMNVAHQNSAVPSWASQGSPVVSPGSKLPGEAQCASQVQNSPWEPRSDNTSANQHVPTTQQIANLSPWGMSMGMSAKADTLRQQLTGNFTGTTDEILQWVACKWGLDVNIMRAQAVQESSWHQSQKGDWTTNKSLCPPGTWTGRGCFQSYGLLQIKYIYNKSAWSMSRDDTAFSVEYTYGLIRACYEGWMTYLSNSNPTAGYPRYHAGDLWGCVGRWYSGSWYDRGAINYINLVKAHLAKKEWTLANF